MTTRSDLLIAVWGALQGLFGQVPDKATEVIWEVGGPNAPEESTWISVDGGVIGEDRVIVADARAPSVRSYGLQNGEWLATYGSAGKGPAEYERPGEISLVGDSVRVLDFLQRRWSIFSLGGQHLRTTQAGHPPVTLEWGSLLGQDAGVGLTAWRDDGRGEVDRAVVLWDGPSVDTIASFSMNHVFFKWEGIPEWRSTQKGIGAAGDAVPLGDTLVAVLDGLQGILTLWPRESGRRVQLESIALGEHGERVSDEEGRWIGEQTKAALGGLHPRWEDRLRVPEHWSAWTEVLNGSDGTVWLRRGGPGFAFAQGEQMWYQMDLASRSFIGRIILDKDIRLIAVRRHLALTVRVDALDVEHLQLRQIG
jgi:hypothetical protein